MKVTKTQAVLALYDAFLTNSVVRKKDFLASVEISDISFKRYMSELRCYFTNFAPGFSIDYNRKEDAYHLIRENPVG